MNFVGVRHAGIGLDYVRNVDSFWRYVDDNPEAWPANHGKPNSHTRFAQPEQVEELAERMCRKNYSEAAIRSILAATFIECASTSGTRC